MYTYIYMNHVLDDFCIVADHIRGMIISCNVPPSMYHSNFTSCFQCFFIWKNDAKHPSTRVHTYVRACPSIVLHIGIGYALDDMIWRRFLAALHQHTRHARLRARRESTTSIQSISPSRGATKRYTNWHATSPRRRSRKQNCDELMLPHAIVRQLLRN